MRKRFLINLLHTITRDMLYKSSPLLQGVQDESFQFENGKELKNTFLAKLEVFHFQEKAINQHY